MPCSAVRLPGGGHAFINSRHRIHACIHCGEIATLLCDFPTGPGKTTCDARLCRKCAHHIEPDSDYCRPHAVGQPPSTPEPAKPTKLKTVIRDGQQMRIPVEDEGGR